MRLSRSFKMSLVAKPETQRAHVSGIVLFQRLICCILYIRLRDCYVIGLALFVSDRGKYLGLRTSWSEKAGEIGGSILFVILHLGRLVCSGNDPIYLWYV